uniref:Obg family GTPase CgtA n=1 Tax=Anaplasma marginale TaxID=770 RepID=UPI001F51BAF9
KIHVKGGKGGDGCVSFRREKFIEFGGPDGGNGGNGGSVIFVASSAVNTLLYFRYNQHIRAENGKAGSGKGKFGAAGRNRVVEVPVGTQLYDEDGNTLIADLNNIGQQYTVAAGGRGGIGNAQYKSSTNRAPTYFTYGTLGEEHCVLLKLKIVSDVGIIGMPNAGKSSLLSRCTASKTKVSDYPFTTLEPHLGVAYANGCELVLADIPGLIENASSGAGLGHKFLKHIERCVILLHLVDCSLPDIVSAYELVRQELKLHSQELAGKQEVVILNKCDLLSEEEVREKQKLLESSTKKEVITLSVGDELDSLIVFLHAQVKKAVVTEPSDTSFDPFLYVHYNKK